LKLATVEEQSERALRVLNDICTKCRGAKVLPNGDGTMRPCDCVFRERFIKYIGYLRRYTTLPDTPLLPLLRKRQSVIIEIANHDVFNSHLKTALLRRKDTTLSWLVVTPEELMSLSFNPDLREKQRLYDSDLLVIKAPTLPYYEAANKQLEYVLTSRAGTGKITWFVSPGFKKLMAAKIQWTDGCREALLALPVLRLDKNATTKVAMEVRRVVAKPELGPGIDGVDKKLLQLKKP
jgi:hypothetical protein